ncbi:hypothetical protein ACQ4M3_37695 [Leptolyngbya sp. AN03gr2]|uniref:hypothetical protein n=1 Tax=unclassified Leptolyngbya TaxID=2650499 RepID=UPI003D30FA2B
MLTTRSNSMTRIHLFAIAIVAVLVMIPMFAYGVYDAHDLPDYHLRWAKQFSDQFWAGDLYPRWLLKMNAGMGSPTFFFYSPMPYYFTSLMRLLVWIPDPYGWHQLSLGAALALIASGITAYLWLRSIVSPTAALFASLFYLVAPYHLAIDLYARFAYAEFWSFVWFPLILYFTQQLIEGRKKAIQAVRPVRSIVGIAIAQTFLIMTHLPSFLIFTPVPLLYVLWFSDRKRRWRNAIAYSLAFLLAVGLAAIYWFPAMTTKEFIVLKADPTQYKFFHYEDNFLFSGVFRENLGTYIAFLEISTVLTIVLAVLSFLIGRRTTPQKLSLFWIAIALSSGAMMFSISNPVWQVLQPLQTIELPSRFNLVLTLALTALVAFAVQPIRFTQKFFLTSGVLLVLGTGLAMLLLLPVRDAWLTWTVPNKAWLTLSVMGIAIAVSFVLYSVRLINHRVIAITVLLAIALMLSSGLLMKRSLYPVTGLDAELEIQRDAVLHRPKWIPPSLYTTEALREFTAEKFGSNFTIEAQDQVKILQWQPRKLGLQTNLNTEQWLTLKQVYYPGWTATIDSSTLPVQASPEGLLQIKVPAGNLAIAVELKPLLQEQIGVWLSAISSILLSALLCSQSGFAKPFSFPLRSFTSIK